MSPLQPVTTWSRGFLYQQRLNGTIPDHVGGGPVRGYDPDLARGLEVGDFGMTEAKLFRGESTTFYC